MQRVRRFCCRRRKYKREILRRSRASLGFKNVALPNALGDWGTIRETERVPPKTYAGRSKPQMAAHPGRQSPSRRDVSRHHPLAVPYQRSKTPPRPRRETGSSRQHLPPPRFQSHQESRPRRSGSGGFPSSQALRVILSSTLVFAPPRRCYDKNSAMATSIATPSESALPAERFFRTSLSLLILTSTVTLVSTGKLEVITSFAAPLIVLYKGFRSWHGRPAELSQRSATWYVLAYLAFFPVDALFLSRFSVGNSSNPPLFAALLGVVHFLIFVTVVRFYSAVTDRDALFLSMLSFAGILAAAVLTVDTTFLILFFIFLLFGVSTFVGMELRRGAVGAVSPALHMHPERDRRLNRALSLSALTVATGSIVLGSVLFFFFPRFSAGYLGRASFSPSLMSGFTENVELGQIGEIKKNSAVVMRVQTGKPIGYDRLRWRGIALKTFDGSRWACSEQNRKRLQPSEDGWIHVADPPEKRDSPN